MLNKILIANRGEIAARIARTCLRLGVEYVAVYSDADADAPYLHQAAASVRLGPALAAHSYLNGERLIQAALEQGCDAIHPGYGFLSENAGFAQAVADAGLIFIGPQPDTIAMLGDKARAKGLMRAAGVPIVPGSDEASEDERRVAELVAQVGYPVLLKPSAGGGGKGMQIVHQAAQLPAAIAQGIRLARANFGDGRLLVERFVENPRHIEVQIFGDGHGNVVHLFERECSLQRRHQKVVEEAPAASLDKDTRNALLAAAVRGARTLEYRNAGTFEFIVSADGDFYFLEVNTRLQVEHPVSEEITGQDLVEWQLRVAAGQALPLRQEQIQAHGHAIECRVYAEDPANDFQPTPGPVRHLHWPAGVRVESGIAAGAEVSPFYDPMVAKLVVHAHDRNAAIERMLQALEGSTVFGLTTNLGYLTQILSDPAVRANAIHTRYLDQQLARYKQQTGPQAALACAAALSLHAMSAAATERGWPWCAAPGAALLDRPALDPDNPLGKLHFWLGASLHAASLLGHAGTDTVRVGSAGREYLVRLAHHDDQPGGQSSGHIDSAGMSGRAWHAWCHGDTLEILVAGQRCVLQPYASRSPSQPSESGLAAAPMPGVVVALPVAVGAPVRVGTVLAIVEAMKMEHKVLAQVDGRVDAVHCRVGENIAAGQLLVSVEESPEDV